ncbi:hypothetical protein QBC38DRAFT_251846 [Podospora fimiseda]|uniref:Uncharacterized protein n=1 Tax=Podospora fimiseda TaxID=252190 RepID=A0AAN7GSA2_9PEZI|nr:hypothetical protein QBC38DRAFT_251846 [Podospora fimiseda]
MKPPRDPSLGFADRLKAKLYRTPSRNHLVAPDPSSAGDVYSGVSSGPNNPRYGGPLLGAIPETTPSRGIPETAVPSGGYYYPSSQPFPSSSPPLPQPKRPSSAAAKPLATQGFVFGRGGAGNHKAPKTKTHLKNPSRESLLLEESATASSSTTNTYQTEESRHSFSGVSSKSSTPAPAPTPAVNKPDNTSNPGGYSTKGDDSDPRASNAEVQRCIKLLRQLFELRIQIWGMRKAHWSMQPRRNQVKRQARDLHKDINQIVVDWKGMPRSTWTVDEAEIIGIIAEELRGLRPFWEEGVEVDDPNS